MPTLKTANLSSLLIQLACAAMLCAGFMSATHAREQYTSKQVMGADDNLDESASTSVQDLEKSLSTMSDDYARSSTQRFLAHHYLETKEYDKAIKFYEDALKEGGLSSFANLEMMQELIQVYLLKQDYAQVAATIKRFESGGGKPNATIYLMRAHASFKLNDKVDTQAALDKAMAAPGLTPELMNYALSLNYGLGNYSQCAALMEKLISEQPNNPENWFKLASLYIKLKRYNDALNILSLAWEKHEVFRAQDLALLSDLYASTGNWFRAAQIYQQGIEQHVIQPESKDYQRLYNYWSQAREKELAIAALEKAAAIDRDTTLALYLAQLYLDSAQWEKMQNIILRACENPLKDQYVSQTNLLLGISQLKLGKREAARRSFINATVLGGAGDTAGQYLQFMRAEPASDNEKRSVVGPCRSPSTTSLFSSAKLPEEKISNTPANSPVQIKVTPSQTIFFGEYTMTADDFKNHLTGKAIQLGLAAAKSGGTMSGPMMLIFDKAPDPNALSISFKMGFPITGNPAARGQFKVMGEPGFRCAFLMFDGSPEQVESTWKQFFTSVTAAGYTPTGQARQIIDPSNTANSKTVKLELQIGIQP